MFDQILDLVKDQLGNDQQVAQHIPSEKKEQVHREVATHLDKEIKQQAATSGLGGMLSNLQNSAGSGNPLSNAIQGGIVGTLGSKLGLPPAATGAIAAALPGLLQRFAHKVNDPNDSSITAESIGKSLGGKFGNFF